MKVYNSPSPEQNPAHDEEQCANKAAESFNAQNGKENFGQRDANEMKAKLYCVEVSVDLFWWNWSFLNGTFSENSIEIVFENLP